MVCRAVNPGCSVTRESPGSKHDEVKAPEVHNSPSLESSGSRGP